jgi:arginyl-tRNA synthetase
MADDNALLHHNQELCQNTVVRRDEIVARHLARNAADVPDPLGALKTKLRAVLQQASGLPSLDVHIDLLDRDRFGADLVLKFPGLLRDGGPRGFAQKHVDWILRALADPSLTGEIVAVDSVGMYINLTLSDSWLLDAGSTIIEAGQRYGASNSLADERYVVDYSSPNVAKRLHAGHIRSTIIGDVLTNLLEEAGGLVFGVNHINDFGGFGFLLEGHRRFADALGDELTLNERSLEIYRVRRVLERAVADGASIAELPDDDADVLNRLISGLDSRQSIAQALRDFTVAADRRFAALESGDPAEVGLWIEIVSASLDDFRSFYRSLAISIDFTLGESFYAQAGLAMVDDWLESGAAVLYGELEAAADLELLHQARTTDEISENEFESLTQAIRKDVGAVVVRLSPSERYVVRRQDGRSIYATRDLAAVAIRGKLFDPTCCIYVVGQEQQSHFERLFATSYQLGLANPDRNKFEHLFHGFYVDPRTGKKLSSRESAAAVTQLFEVAREYFESRQSDRQATTPGDDDVANQLTVASVVFNDLKQDIRSKVDMDTNDMVAVVKAFEKSGGAYVIYSACRAGSIVRKATEVTGSLPSLTGDALDSVEVALLLEVLHYPGVVASAAQQHEVSMLVRYLLNLSNLYNSYYAKFRVITEGGVVASRLLITAAVEGTIRNGLRLCNVECPEFI